MRRMLNILLAMLIMVPIVSSCVHEWPDESTPADLLMEFTFDTDLPPHLTVYYDTKTQESSVYDVRYTVEAYRKLPNSDGYDDIPHFRGVYIKDDIQELNHTVTVSVSEGDYEFRVWVDYVKQGTEGPLFYDNSNFYEVLLIGDHVGNTDFRDAFVGSGRMSVKRLSSFVEPQVCKIQMERPLAKFDIVATDMELFLTKQLELLMMKEGEDDQTKQPIEIDLNDYTVKVYYDGNMPFSFDVELDRPNDAKTGVTFDSKIKYINTSEASMCSDYVFVNGKESKTFIVLEVYDKENEVVARTGKIEIPIIRSKLTTVKGEFLTSHAQGGVGISPGFDGDFVVEY